jgi:opacity protein-like surface antigen
MRIIMLRLATLAIAGSVAAMAAAPAAHAAEPYYPPQPYQEPFPEPVPELPPPAVSGWYLRGDISYDVYKDPKVHYNEDVFPLKFKTAEIDDTWNIGFGFGYRFNDWFRTDATFAYHHTTDFRGTTGGECAPWIDGKCFSKEKAQVTKFTALANAYVDLGHWWGVSPYVGAGIGGAFIDWSNYHFVNVCEGPCGGFVFGGHDWWSNSDWHFAWALMAGVAVDLTPNLALDVGYRFVNIDDGVIIKDNEFLNGDVKFKDLREHEARIGLRYTFAAPQPFIPDAPPPPVVAKF